MVLLHLESKAVPWCGRLDPVGGQAHRHMPEGHIEGESVAHNDRAALVLVVACEDRKLPAAEGALALDRHKACACPSDAVRTDPHVAACRGKDQVGACHVVQTPKVVAHWELGRNCLEVAVPGYQGAVRRSDRDRGAYLPLAARACYHSLFHKRAGLTVLEAAARVPCTGHACPHHRQRSRLLADGRRCSPLALALAHRLCWCHQQHRCRQRLASSCGHGRRHLPVPSPPQGGPPSSGLICVEPP